MFNAHDSLLGMDNSFSTTWYDVFSLFYDASMGDTYDAHRQQALDALAIAPGMTVVDVGCGTGASFPLLTAAVRPQGKVVGLDASRGMLRKAEARVRREAWQNVELFTVEADTAAQTVQLARRLGRIDRVQCFLSLSVISNWQQVFDSWFNALAPGGRFVIADVHEQQPSAWGHMVELTSRGRLKRRSWEPLERACPDFRIEWQESHWMLGGAFYVASGTRR